jgi:hypothetical protein
MTKLCGFIFPPKPAVAGFCGFTKACKAPRYDWSDCRGAGSADTDSPNNARRTRAFMLEASHSNPSHGCPGPAVTVTVPRRSDSDPRPRHGQVQSVSKEALSD